MDNTISFKNALISGIISVIIGIVSTYLINWGTPIEQINELFIAVGTASFCAGFGGNIAGQRYN